MRDSVTSLAPVGLFLVSCWLLLAHLVASEGGLDFGCRLVQVGVCQVDVQFFFGILETKFDQISSNAHRYSNKNNLNY